MTVHPIPWQEIEQESNRSKQMSSQDDFIEAMTDQDPLNREYPKKLSRGHHDGNAIAPPVRRVLFA